MKNPLLWLSAILIGIFWPVAIIGANPDGWLSYVLVLSVVTASWLLYKKGFRQHFFLFLLLPMIHPAYLFFPVFFILFYLKETPKILLLIFAIALIATVFFSWKTFYAYSIFTPDPLSFDTLNKKISLIPSRNLARLFHNKTDLYQDKFKANVFTSLDQNNYFFALHPREIFENQNLNKFPYPALIPFLIGLFYLASYIHKKWIISVILAGILSIAMINNQDKFDIILYLPIFLICLLGLKKVFTLPQKSYFMFSSILIFLSFIELLRLLTSFK